MNLFKKDQLNLKQFSLDQDQKKYSILDYNFKLFFKPFDLVGIHV